MVKPLLSFALLCLFYSQAHALASEPKEFRQVMKAHGGKSEFYRMRDVQFIRQVCTPPSSNKCSRILERFLFEDEKSFGEYVSDPPPHRKEWFDGNSIRITQPKPSPKTLKAARIRRQASYWWFSLPFKLGDDGLQTQRRKPRTLEGTPYRILELRFKPGVGHASDTYLIYLDPQNLIRWVHFTQHELRPNQWFLMKMELHEVSGIQLFSKRTLFESNEKGELGKVMEAHTLSQIQFWNGFTEQDFVPPKLHQEPFSFYE